eukprot:scaffold2102_cov161-Amphora_coffeaeformis.AAC.22
MSYEYADDDIIEPEGVPLILYMLAGCIAGSIETTAMWPFEYIKTQLQLHRQLIQRRNKAADEEKKDGILIMASEEEHEEMPYNDMFGGFVYTVRVYGFWALYGGLAPTLIGSIPKAGIRFGLDAWLNDLLRDDQGQTSAFSLFFAGVVAGVVEALVIVAPVETIKTKCIELNMSFVKGLREILVTEGIWGIYHGVLATVLKQGSNHGLRFLWYHVYKRILTNDGETELTLFESFIGGMTAGIFSALGNQPFDVLKTLMQGVHAEEQYSSTWDCVVKTFQAEGIAGFYTGLIPRLTRVI